MRRPELIALFVCVGFLVGLPLMVGAYTGELLTMGVKDLASMINGVLFVFAVFGIMLKTLSDK
jgi:hypothetical protein